MVLPLQDNSSATPVPEVQGRVVMTKIFVTGLKVEAEIGVYAHEKGHAQPLVVDVELDVPTAGASRLADTVNYETIGESARAMLEAGARLALIRSQEPHGEWEQTCGVLNLLPRTAQRMISSALKFSNATTSSQIERLGTSKLFELLVLDDDDAEILTSGGSLDGIGDLDDVSKMTVRELRAALREAREESHAKDSVLAGKSQKIDNLQTQLERKKKSTPSEEWEWAPYRNDLLGVCEGLVNSIEADMRRAMLEINQQAEQSGGLPEVIELARAHALTCVMQSLIGIQNEFAIEVDLESIITPPWMAEAAAPATSTKKAK